MKTDQERVNKRRKMLKESRRFVYRFNSAHVLAYAASITLYLFLSLIPLFIILCVLLPYSGLSMETLIENVTRMTPDIVDDFITSIIREAYSKRTGVFSVSLFMLLWSASGAIRAIAHSLDVVYGVDQERKYGVLVALSLLYTVIIVVLIILGLYLTIRWQGFESMIKENSDSELVEKGQNYWHTFLLYAGLTLFIALMYKFIPVGKRAFIHQFPGALLTSLGWYVFSYFFQYYVNGKNIFSDFYGSLTVISVFLFWLYWSFAIFLTGALVNSYFEIRIKDILPTRNRSDRSTDGSEKTGKNGASPEKQENNYTDNRS